MVRSQRDIPDTTREHSHFTNNPRPVTEVDNPWPFAIVRVGPILNVCIPGELGSIAIRKELMEHITVPLSLEGYGYATTAT